MRECDIQQEEPQAPHQLSQESSPNPLNEVTLFLKIFLEIMMLMMI